MGMSLGSMGNGNGIPAIQILPGKYNPAVMRHTIERYNRLYGYPIAVVVLDNVKKTFGIGTIGLFVQALALAMLVAMPIWMYNVGLDNLAIFGNPINHNILLLVVLIATFVILFTGFLLSRKYTRVHYGAMLSCGIFTHIIPIHAALGFIFGFLWAAGLI